jgi:biopolymer transport protein TolR
VDYAQRRQRHKHESHVGHVRPRPVMNVTPLVDVVLVLLIIFMVVIPALQQGMNLEMAGIVNVDETAKSKTEPFTVSLDRDNQIVFEDETLTQKQLAAKLRAASKKQPGRRVVVRADKSVEYTKVREVYRIVQATGFPGVSLRVNRVNPEE